MEWLMRTTPDARWAISRTFLIALQVVGLALLGWALFAALGLIAWWWSGSPQNFWDLGVLLPLSLMLLVLLVSLGVGGGLLVCVILHAIYTYAFDHFLHELMLTVKHRIQRFSEKKKAAKTLSASPPIPFRRGLRDLGIDLLGGLVIGLGFGAITSTTMFTVNLPTIFFVPSGFPIILAICALLTAICLVVCGIRGLLLGEHSQRIREARWQGEFERVRNPPDTLD